MVASDANAVRMYRALKRSYEWDLEEPQPLIDALIPADLKA